MSDTASLELCKELYGLSGWYDQDMFTWSKYHVAGSAKGFKDYEAFRVELGGPEDIQSRFEKDARVPAYDAGYLLRKLPQGEIRNRAGRYSAWMNNDKAIEPVYADTPEDALALLCIEMFKAGILPISGRD